MELNGINKYNPLKPLLIQKFQSFLPVSATANPTQQINSLITYLNQIGKLSNDVVADWNKVMGWVMNEGLTDTLSDRLETFIQDGTFDQYVDPLVNEITNIAKEQIELINNNQVAVIKDVFLKADGININDFDEATRTTFLEQNGIDVNYVLGDNNVMYNNLNQEIKDVLTLENEVINQTEKILTLTDMNIVNTDTVTYTSPSFYIGALQTSRYFGGFYVKTLEGNEYSYTIKNPFNRTDNQFWHIYKVDADFIYMLETRKDRILNYKVSRTTSTATVLETIVALGGSTGIATGSKITVKRNGTTHQYLSDGVLFATVTDCNTVGIASGASITSSVEFVSGFNTYIQTVKSEVVVDAQKVRLNGVALPDIISTPEVKYLTNKRVCFMGDSLTNNSGTYTSKGYFQYIKEWYNTTNFVDGQNGSRIRDNVSDSARAMCNRYVNLPNDYDVYIVFGGTNDWNSKETGVLGSYGDIDVHTFYGAMETLCKGMVTLHPDKMIVFMLPFKYFQGDNRPVITAMTEILNKYSIPFFDYYKNGGITPDIAGQVSKYMLPDKIHFNEAGHELIANRLAGFINELMK